MKNFKFLSRKTISFVIAFIILFSTVNFNIKAAIPTSYDLRDYGYVTSVKNQGNANSCWVFATIGAIESSLIVGGYADSSIDLSEAHLGWFSINSAISNENDLTYGDGLSVDNPYQYSGNDLYAIWAISRGFGLEFEEFSKYNVSDPDSTFVRESSRNVSEYTVSQLNIYEPSESDSIKQAIITNGAVMASYRDSSGYYTRGNDGYCFYENVYTETNHATLIIGWDDDFSKENFGDLQPSSNGAWLCRNTRGTSWGDNGYFWLSYETTSLKRIVSFVAEPSENDIYQIYQYDGYGFSKALSINDSGIVYTSNIFDITENGCLEKIAFYTAMTNLNHDITIYRLNESYSSPVDGEVISNFSKSCNNLGYYLCDLPSPVNVYAGDAISIVVKISGSGRIKFYSEGTENRASINGKSFASPDGISWVDTAQNNFGNLCIKAWVDPDVYEGPDIISLYNKMLPISEEYYEDNILSSVMDKVNKLDLTGSTDRETLNCYLRLVCLYEKYFGFVTVENEEQFIAFANLVNSGNKFTDTVIVLTGDLDFTNISFTVPSEFNGIFNGKYHSIKGITYQSGVDAGLFGTICQNGIVKNVVMNDCSFVTSEYAGGIAARNEGLIIDCAVSASLSSEYLYSGLVAGFNKGKVLNCAVKGDSGEYSFGEIVGENTFGIIQSCLYSGNSPVCDGNAPIESHQASVFEDVIMVRGLGIPMKNVSLFASLYHSTPNSYEGNAYTGAIIENFKISVLGDIDGDGELSASDYLKIKSYFLEIIDLSDVYLSSADIDQNGFIEATDYLLIKSHFLNITDIYGV